jgi:para-nitrobenzyl esterase
MPPGGQLRMASSVWRISFFGLLFGAAALAQPPQQEPAAGPIVTVTGGKVQGRLLSDGGAAVFKGIPYAAPPVGNLRWRPPQPVGKWTGMLQADDYRSDCPHVPRDIAWSASGAGSFSPRRLAPASAPEAVGEAAPTSEDCLYLNIWTPEWPSAKRKPVLFWIHGSELAGGTARLKSGPAEQAESSLARRGVVVVSINYRGGLLGMMGHPELTAEDPHHSSGNYLLFDQIAALKWVRDNIARFGGDPSNVTAFGQSGGGRSTAMLVTSPLAKGLMQRAIIDSGGPTELVKPFTSLREMEQIGVLVAKALKAPSTDAISYLRSLPADQIVATLPMVRSQLDAMDYQALDEGIDGYAIPRSPAEAFRDHKEAHIPIIIGNTALDSTTLNAANPLPKEASHEQVRAWAKNMLQVFYAKYADLLDQALKAYAFNDGPNDVPSYPPYGTFQQLVGIDLNHRCGTIVASSWHSAVAPTYQYEFSYATLAHPPTHESDLRFIFGYFSKDELSDVRAQKMSDQMQSYWVNFARTGNPNGPDLPVWPKYDVAKRQSIEFTNDGPVQRSAIRAMACSPYLEKANREPELLRSGEHQQLRPGG